MNKEEALKQIEELKKFVEKIDKKQNDIYTFYRDCGIKPKLVFSDIDEDKINGLGLVLIVEDHDFKVFQKCDSLYIQMKES